MTKPVSALQWTPDTADPQALRAIWAGAGWHYIIHWGDGTKERRLWHQPPARHVYPSAGRYTILCVNELHNNWTISTEVVLRDQLEVGATFELVPGTSTVRATLAPVAEPVRYRIDWGDGTKPPSHDQHDLNPEHTYPWGFGPTHITVVDVPSRRLSIFTGPTIPEQPTDPPARKAHWTFHTGWFDEQNRVRGKFAVGRLPPGTRIAGGVWLNSEVDPWIDTCRDDGSYVFPEFGYTSPHAAFWPPYLHGHAWLPDDPDWPGWTVPILAREDGRQPCTPLYAVDIADPWRITLTVAEPKAGRYTIDFGDGTPTREVDCDGLVLHAVHEYPPGSRGPYTIKVTDPEGNQGHRRIGAPTYKAPKLYNGADLYVTPETLGGDDFTPTYVSWGYPRDQNGDIRPIWVSTGLTNDRVHRYPDTMAGRTATVRVVGPLHQESHTVHIGEMRKHMSGPPALVAEGYVYAKTTVGLRITNLFAWADKASLSSPAFAESTPFPLEIKTEEGRRFGRASIPIGEIDAGEYAATLHLPHSITQQLRVIVEDKGDGTFEASWAKVPDGTLHYLKASGLSRNASHAEAKTALAHGNGWFGLIKEPYGTNAKGTAVPAADLKPGATYPVEVKLIFPGGFEDIVKGAVTLPLPEPKAVLPGFKVRHQVNLAVLGEGDTVTHKISFGSLKQTNTEYVVAWTRKCHDPQGKPVKPTREEAAELALLEPYHYVRHLDHVELHTVNPHKLRGNTRFKPVYIVKIDPVVDDDSYGGGDEGDDDEA